MKSPLRGGHQLQLLEGGQHGEGINVDHIHLQSRHFGYRHAFLDFFLARGSKQGWLQAFFSKISPF